MRVAAAAAVLGVVAFVTPQPTLACSGPVPTRDEAIDAATVILAGRVVAKPGEWAYELAVDEVFRGPQRDSVVIGELAPSTPPICSHQLEIDDRVVVALRDAADLGLFSSAVWLLLPDGTVGTIAAEPPAATHDELLAHLRLLPDTAVLGDSAQGSPAAAIGAILLGTSLAIACRRRVGTGDARAVTHATSHSLARDDGRGRCGLFRRPRHRQ